jgi:hypothetical protein
VRPLPPQLTPSCALLLQSQFVAAVGKLAVLGIHRAYVGNRSPMPRGAANSTRTGCRTAEYGSSGIPWRMAAAMESRVETTGPRYRPLGANLPLLQIRLSGGDRLPTRCCRHCIASGDVESKGKNGASGGCHGRSAVRPRSVLRNLLSYESSKTRLRTRRMRCREDHGLVSTERPTHDVGSGDVQRIHRRENVTNQCRGFIPGGGGVRRRNPPASDPNDAVAVGQERCEIIEYVCRR